MERGDVREAELADRNLAHTGWILLVVENSFVIEARRAGHHSGGRGVAAPADDLALREPVHSSANGTTFPSST